MDAAAWAVLNRLLDEALELPPQARAEWIDGVGPEHHEILPLLRRLLAGADSAAFLDSIPKIDLTGEAGRGNSGDDTVLRDEVEQLLRVYDRAAGGLAAPAFANASQMLPLLHRLTTVLRQSGAGELDTPFRGTERFTVLRRLGAGGMGVVYAAHDRLRNEVVALKTLRRARPPDVYRLKREFRGLADIAHPNVVCLYELIVEGELCFFTMELVNGVGISEYVRAAVADAPPRVEIRADAERTRNIVRQLVAGLSALHRKGKLHRDIKPSNVMVTPEGRLVILDFGLISDVIPDDAQTAECIAGTPAYLAPEQYRGAVPSEASDWYAVGVTLYEALTGRALFEGSVRELRQRKCERDPPPPVQIAPSVPDDLNEICTGLLCRTPAQRFTGRDVLERLVTAAGEEATPFAPQPRPRKPLFVGRTRQSERLREAFAAASGGRAAAVYVHGPSGIGKTTLAQHFLDELAARHDDIVILRGRCYEHESVPYKALDGIVDSLTTYLGALPPSKAASLLPADVGALARAFPVMLRVEAVAGAPRAEAEHREPAAQRRQAFSALREVLTRLAHRHPLVLFIDDLHWADADSTRIIETLLDPPHPPPLLLMACLRTEEIASKPFLQRLLNANACTPLALEPMTEDEACDVIARLVPAATPLTVAARLGLAREAGGNPFLLEQLAQHACASDGGTGATTFAHVLDRRFHGLPGEARHFLEVLAVCGRPMAPPLVHAAAGLAGDERPLVALLRADHLLRNSGSASRIVLYHDRIRETLAARLSADETRDIHRALIRTLTAEGFDEAEALFEHYQGAGDGDGASRQAVRAARRAHAALAFDRAAFFYRRALELTPRAAEAVEWQERLAESLTNAGRPHEAGAVYLEASGSAPRTQQVDLQRLAAEQFLIGGHIDRGLAVTRTVLRAVNLRLAPSPLTALASLIWWRLRTRWRGLDSVGRDSSQIPAETLLRIDTGWSVATGLAMVDTIRAAAFNAQHLFLALEAGEPYRIARSLALETVFLVSGGTHGGFVDRCAEWAAHYATQSGAPHAEAVSALCAGGRAFLAGHWSQAAMLCEQALQTLRERCPGATWEINFAEEWVLFSLLLQGDIRAVSRRMPDLLRAANDRGNLYFATELRTRMNIVWLAADEPDEGERHANEAMEGWSHEGFHRQHYNHVLARVQTELYRGRAEVAWHLVASNWHAFARTLLVHVQFLRIETSYLRGRAALLMAASGHDVKKFLAIARTDARRIHRLGVPWSEPLAMLLSAAASCIDGRSRDALTHLAAAISAFDRAGMNLHAAVARRRLGALRQDNAGRELTRQADEWMVANGIRNPARIARLFAPGFADPPGA
jgi:hypothetical protein